jgi:tRNA(Ile)-lysidine synthase
VPSLTQKVLAYIRQQDLVRAGDRLGVAVSGGADSVALLRVLVEMRDEVGTVLSIIHLNHQLRGEESEGDQQFVAALAQKHALEFHHACADVRKHARNKHLSLEAAGRAVRYDYFRKLLEQGLVDRIATAHTQDDQAETVLLRLVRGAGTRGLAGIYPKVRVPGKKKSAGAAFLVRPLLNTTRKEVEAYLAEAGQSRREDSSNRDERHARNRVRLGLLPWLEQNLNPSVRETLSEAAEVARAEQDYWESQIAKMLPAVFSQSPSGSGQEGQMDVAALESFPLALQRRLLRAAGSALGILMEFQQVEQVLALLRAPSARGPWPLPGWNVRKSAGKLLFQAAGLGASGADFEYALPVPGGVAVGETQSEFHATIIPVGSCGRYNPHDLENQHLEDLMDARLLAQELRVRNWREGDRFWPAHTKAPRKIKELLTERHVTGMERKAWPVIVSEDEVVWMRGFPSPSRLRLADGGGPAIRIQEIPMGGNIPTEGDKELHA